VRRILLAAAVVAAMSIVGLAAPAAAQHRPEYRTTATDVTSAYILWTLVYDRFQEQAAAFNDNGDIRVNWVTLGPQAANCNETYDDPSAHVDHIKVFNDAGVVKWERIDTSTFNPCSHTWQPDITLKTNHVYITAQVDIHRKNLSDIYDKNLRVDFYQ
jgi:hypothetical protein